MGGYKGEVADITKAHKNLSDVKADLDNAVNNLESAMAEALTTWRGAAADSFRQLMERVDEKGRSLNQSLQNLADLLEQAGSTYQRMEEEGASSFSGGSFSALDG